ncbi:threonine/serine exporter family protein [Tannockella kyphosi]|uniref:threonine/serine ThrE exporter family protein n=1 Tax=Tannockella kyphosi TaxID=2899121 RepID=UPI002011FCB0|nr:threonine/serine exporter family protein [Tannockella kyphosi]
MEDTKIFNNITYIGKLLLRHGSEIYRVEESITRLLLAYGFKEVEVFAIPSYLNVSATSKDNQLLSKTIRSFENKINLDSLHELNKFIRSTCLNPLSIEELEKEILRIESIPVYMQQVFIGYGLTAGFFTVFFGGGFKECLLGMFVGFMIYIIFDIFEKLEVNLLVKTFVSSISLAAICNFAFYLGIIQNLEACTIGSLMVLVPGVAITNSLRDIIGGEYLSGLTRMLEAILIATSIALGVGVVMMALGG